MKNLAIFSFIVCLSISCTKESVTTSPNAYDKSKKPPDDTTGQFTVDSSSFQFLYYNVFSITCANSGCHDGNFQPDFRTMYSSYNTLVRHSVIQNDAQNSFKFRVEPYNVEKSVLHERLTAFMPNSSGIMPLSIDSGSSWLTDSSTFKKLIFDWIKRGAPDAYGNLPGPTNFSPQVTGMAVFPSGNTTNPYQRLQGSTSPVSIPPFSPVDVWFAFEDDKTPSADFKLTKVRSSYQLFDFTPSTEYSLAKQSPISGLDFENNNVSFTHKATMNFPDDTIGVFIHLRTYLRDGEQADTTEIPSAGTNDIMRSFFTLKVDSI